MAMNFENTMKELQTKRAILMRRIEHCARNEKISLERELKSLDYTIEVTEMNRFNRG